MFPSHGDTSLSNQSALAMHSSITDKGLSQLFQAATDLVARRLPTGEAVAAAILTQSHQIYTGIWIDAALDAAALCAETGPICEAHRTNEVVLASVCVMRESTNGDIQVVPACGICQERLSYWGMDLVVGIPGTKIDGVCDFLPLSALRPHYWRDVLPKKLQ